MVDGSSTMVEPVNVDILEQNQGKTMFEEKTKADRDQQICTIKQELWVVRIRDHPEHVADQASAAQSCK